MKLYNILLGMLSASNVGSSKRAIVLLSYLSAIAISWVCLLQGIALDSNLLILVLSLAGLSTGNYALTVKNEAKDDNPTSV